MHDRPESQSIDPAAPEPCMIDHSRVYRNSQALLFSESYCDNKNSANKQAGKALADSKLQPSSRRRATPQCRENLLRY
jgi:hypothetical protein